MADQPGAVAWEAIHTLIDRVPVVQRFTAEHRAMLEQEPPVDGVR